MISLLIIAMSSGHVPTYQDCSDNCCIVQKQHTISQVFYFKGTGGIEIHLDSDTSPIDTLSGEMINFDVTFRDEVDQSTYELIVGCGGCAAKDPYGTALELRGYKSPVVEPFTQTVYRSPINNTQFNSSLLRTDVCNTSHFSIRLRDLNNRSDHQEIFWSAVIGLGESFTFGELLEFPVYILRNHGDTWNQLGFTYWIHLFIGAPILVNAVRELLRYHDVDVLDPYPLKGRQVDMREPFYEVAIIGFTAAALEELTHLLYAQSQAPVSHEFWLGILFVILFAQGAGVVFVIVVWRGLRNRYVWCISHPRWAPLEIATGISFLFLLGSGFYLGPAGIILAGIVRLREGVDDCCFQIECI